MPTSKEDVQALSARADAATGRLAEVRQSIAKSIIGLDDVVEQSLAVILSGAMACWSASGRGENPTGACAGGRHRA